MISRCMSTQHPDNANRPSFSEGDVMSHDDEIKEAHYVISKLGIGEQLWDFEGKEADSYVIKKLLSNYSDFFKRQILGENFNITYRVPNPDVEHSDAKVLLETLDSIPRSFDAAKLFYGKEVSPINEIYLPMCTSAEQLIRVREYYQKFVVGKKDAKVFDIPIKKWIGDFKPENIRVTGLFENMEGILGADKIVERFITKEKIKDYQRVWFARSDPALNYGSLATVLIVKLGLMKLHKLEKKLNLQILPIIGCGSAPFRGNMKPTNVDTILNGYPSVQTYTLQSAFKYDYPEELVKDAVKKITSRKRKEPIIVDEKKVLAIIKKLTRSYQEEIQLLAPFVNDFARFVPARRKRKLHIGLFGYSRGFGTHLPRAISFCASFYSMGLPPELLGLSAITKKDIEEIKPFYGNFENDLRDSLKLLNNDNLKYFPKAVTSRIQKIRSIVDYSVDEGHKVITSSIPNYYKKKSPELGSSIVRAAQLRGFLG